MSINVSIEYLPENSYGYHETADVLNLGGILYMHKAKVHAAGTSRIV